MINRDIDLEDLKGSTMLLLQKLGADEVILLTKDELLELDIYKKCMESNKEKIQYILSKAELIRDFYFEVIMEMGLTSGEHILEDEWIEGLLNTIPQELKTQVEETISKTAGQDLKFDEVIIQGLYDPKFGIKMEDVQKISTSVSKDIATQIEKSANTFIKENPAYTFGESVEW